MTRVGRRLIEDFLLPALDDGRYGDRLQWVDKSQLFFSIRWNHKNAAKWTLEDTVVFQDWDKLKGHFHPDIKGYYMQAKQRFRAALYKLSTVRTVPSENKHVKIYQLVLGNEKKKVKEGRESPVVIAQTNIAKEESGIPTPVICRNVNYVEAKTPESSSNSTSSDDSVASEPSDCDIISISIKPLGTTVNNVPPRPLTSGTFSYLPANLLGSSKDKDGIRKSERIDYRKNFFFGSSNSSSYSSVADIRFPKKTTSLAEEIQSDLDEINAFSYKGKIDDSDLSDEKCVEKQRHVPVQAVPLYRSHRREKASQQNHQSAATDDADVGMDVVSEDNEELPDNDVSETGSHIAKDAVKPSKMESSGSYSNGVLDLSSKPENFQSNRISVSAR